MESRVHRFLATGSTPPEVEAKRVLMIRPGYGLYLLEGKPVICSDLLRRCDSPWLYDQPIPRPLGVHSRRNRPGAEQKCELPRHYSRALSACSVLPRAEMRQTPDMFLS